MPASAAQHAGRRARSVTDLPCHRRKRSRRACLRRPATPACHGRNDVGHPGGHIQHERRAVAAMRPLACSDIAAFSQAFMKAIVGVEIVADLHHRLLILQRRDLILRLGDLLGLHVQHARLDVELLVGAQRRERFGVLLLQCRQDQRAVGADVVGELDRLSADRPRNGRSARSSRRAEGAGARRPAAAISCSGLSGGA